MPKNKASKRKADFLEFAKYSDYDVQAAFADKLRRDVMQHIATSDESTAKYFRDTYREMMDKCVSESGGSFDENMPPALPDYITRQSQPSAYGNYIDAAMLGEIYGVNIHVIELDAQGEYKARHTLHDTYDDQAPNIALYNSNNVHWFVNGNTKGDGKCLYNAFLQAARELGLRDKDYKAAPVSSSWVHNKKPSLAKVAPEINAAESKSAGPESASKAKAVFTPPQHLKVDEIYEHQSALLKSANQKSKKMPFAIAFKENVADRQFQELFKVMTREVRDQIQSDYEYARKLAAEELREVSSKRMRK